MDTLVAIFANSLICTLLLFQTIRMLRKRKARYLSTSLLLLMLPAITCWTIFGWLENKQIMFLFGMVTLLLNLITLALYLTRSYRIMAR